MVKLPSPTTKPTTYSGLRFFIEWVLLLSNTMTQLTSDAASDSLYPAIRDTSVRSPQVMRTSVPNIQCERYSVLPYPHRPLVGRTALLLQRLLFASGPSGTLLAEMCLPFCYAPRRKGGADFNRVDVRTAVRVYCEYKT